jgi:hypothetical protein
MNSQRTSTIQNHKEEDNSRHSVLYIDYEKEDEFLSIHKNTPCKEDACRCSGSLASKTSSDESLTLRLDDRITSLKTSAMLDRINLNKWMVTRFNQVTVIPLWTSYLEGLIAFLEEEVLEPLNNPQVIEEILRFVILMSPAALNADQEYEEKFSLVLKRLSIILASSFSKKK